MAELIDLLMAKLVSMYSVEIENNLCTFQMKGHLATSLNWPMLKLTLDGYG